MIIAERAFPSKHSLERLRVEPMGIIAERAFPSKHSRKRYIWS